MQVFTFRTRSLSLGPGRRPGRGGVEEPIKASFFCVRGKRGFLMGRSNRKFVPLECSGPGGSGMAEAVLGGTGGHSPFSGLAGKVSVGAPRGVNSGCCAPKVLGFWTNLLQRVKKDRWLCIYIYICYHPPKCLPFWLVCMFLLAVAL